MGKSNYSFLILYSGVDGAHPDVEAFQIAPILRLEAEPMS
jgi:hypothetical protein